MKNWRAIGYIFLGFGSVFLGYALIAFLGMTSLSPSFLNYAPIALAVNTPWFILAALTYVVGFVGYFAGRENTAISISTNETEIEETEDYESESYENKIDTLWSFLIGVITTIVVLAVHGVLGIWNDYDLIFGVAWPLLSSIAVGSLVGFIALCIIKEINER